MNELILDLCREILDLAEAQKEAVVEERFDELIGLQERRRRIIERIQKFDGAESSDSHFRLPDGKDDPAGEEFSRMLDVIVKEILSIDEEIDGLIRRELNTLIDKMETVHKLKKAFCRGAAVRQGTGGKLNVSA